MKSTLLERCKGKTLSGYVESCSNQYLLLVWSDGCVTELNSEGDEDDSIINEASSYQPLDFIGYDHDKLIEAGVDPDFVQGLKQAAEAKQAQRVAESKETRRREYEKLKKEFEGGST
jgi:hypothetical protein